MHRIMIVDDKAENRYLLRALLQGHGYEVDEAHHGAEALVKSRQSPPLLVISDLLMPVMDGYTLLRHWKLDERLRSIPFVVYTATYTEPKDEQLALDLGADAFIIKPTEPEVFMAGIQKALAKQANGMLSTSIFAAGSEEVLLKQYNEVLVRRLEIKMEQLEQTNRELERDITERKRAEEALRESHAFLEKAQQVAHLGSWSSSLLPEQSLVWSSEIYRIFGLKETEFDGKIASFHALVHPEDRDAVRRASRQAIEQGTSYEIEHRIIRPDGTLRWVHEKAEVVRYPSGTPVRLVGVVQDVTERKHAEEAFANERALLRTLVDNLPMAIYVKDAATRKTLANPVDLRNLGATSEAEVLGKTDFDFFPPEQAAMFNADDQQVLQTAHSILDREEMLARPDGSIRYLLTSKVPLRDAIGRVVGLVGIGHDITERQQAEMRIREQAALLDAANDAIYVLTLDHIVQYWNRGAEQLYGWTNAEALGRKITELGNLDSVALETACAALLKNSAWSGEMKIITRMGKSLMLFCRWTLVRDEQGRPKSALVINTDITEQKKLEAQFLRAQRLEGIGALASGIAHDLNNILSPMLMIAPLLYDKVQDADSRAMLKSVESGAQRGADIIKQLLTFARGTPSARAPIPLRHLLSEMREIIRETFPRDILPCVDMPNDLWPVLGDATQIHQVLLNLCVNARDAMPDGGTLTLAARNAMVDEAMAAMILNARPGPCVCARVTDTGAGIAPENLDRIFNPFFTTKDIGKGTGLGLATVLGIVRGHEGFVRVDSRLGHGTTFEVYFPASPETQTVNTAGPKTPIPRGQGELILVVDDEPSVRDGVRRTLESYGYRVVTAVNGVEGLAVLSQHLAEVRAVLTDMMMPVMNGPTMINALRAIEPRLVILGMTGLPERTAMKGMENLDLKVILDKPFSGDELLRVLNDALQPPGATAPQKGAEQP